MANPTLLLKKSTVAGKVPTTSDLSAGEICLNFADAKIYGKHPGSGVVVQVAAAPTHSHALSDLTQSGATSGQVPTWNGTAWTPQTPSGGGSGSSVVSDTTGMTGASQLTNIVQITQAGYNAIATPNASTLYIIVG